jgi:hypothetical protein
VYWDANNLYGYTMCKHLPIGGHKFKDKPIIEVLNTSDINDKGYTVKLDFSYPEEIHDELKEYPPAPENIAPYIEWFSNYQVEVGLETGAIKYNEKTGEYRNCGTHKLIPHLYKHENYVIDYRNLKYLVKLGIQIDKIHKILEYDQKPWMKSYIEMNTAKRKNAKNEFEKDFYKLMNNAVFGKTMENVKNRMQLYMTTDDEKAMKWFSKLNFKDTRHF